MKKPAIILFAIVLFFSFYTKFYAYSASKTTPVRAFLVVGDNSTPQVADLKSKLKQMRKEGFFNEIECFSKKILAYNFALATQKYYCLNTLKIKENELPLLCIVTLDSKGLPDKVLWRERNAYDSEKAVWALLIKLGVIVNVQGYQESINKKDGSELILIPAGVFSMGSVKGEELIDDYSHQVYLDTYYIGKYEVTNKQFDRFINETGYQAQGSWRDYYKSGTDNYPVVNVTWDDAKAYCNWASLSLPTEAQWEKAARGTDGRKYPWRGDNWPPPEEVGIFYDESAKLKTDLIIIKNGNFYSKKAPTGSFPAGASPYGCLDMAGNVSEWCADLYGMKYYSNSPNKNPTGPESGSLHVKRGGSYASNNEKFFRCAHRDAYYSTSCQDTGFRVCRSVK